ncbi:MAG: hypothetical protein FWH03_02700 [Firmicutes bacterium]|nr:hypothetical protein [Bacillota bacterium]
MPINKTAKQMQSDGVLRTLLTARFGEEKKTQKEKVLVNFRMDKDAHSDFKVYCDHLCKSDVSKTLIEFIQEVLYDNREEIERIKKALNL